VGFTPSWRRRLGRHPDNKPLSHNSTGIVGAAPIWHKFMTQALGSSPDEWYPVPAASTRWPGLLLPAPRTYESWRNRGRSASCRPLQPLLADLHADPQSTACYCIVNPPPPPPAPAPTPSPTPLPGAGSSASARLTTSAT